MGRPRSSCLALMAALALSGCSYGDTILDLATGTTPATKTSTPAATASTPQANAPAAPLPASVNASASAPTDAAPAAQKIPSSGAVPRTAAPNRNSVAAAAPDRSGAAPAAAPSASDRPLVVIRFDQPNVDYEQPLYSAVNRALQRKPSATFTIQAVAPLADSAADVGLNSKTSRENAAKVLHSLTAMGMPADRLSLSATVSPDTQSSEVRIFVR